MNTRISFFKGFTSRYRGKTILHSPGLVKDVFHQLPLKFIGTFPKEITLRMRAQVPADIYLFRLVEDCPIKSSVIMANFNLMSSPSSQNDRIIYRVSIWNCIRYREDISSNFFKTRPTASRYHS